MTKNSGVRRQESGCRGLRLALAALVLSVLSAMLWSSSAWAQAPGLERDNYVISASGGTVQLNNLIGITAFSMEVVISGSPASITVMTTGCMRGGTCDVLDTYTTVANAIRQIQGNYDNYQVTATWSGGTSPTVKLNCLVINSTTVGAFISQKNITTQPVPGPAMSEKSGRWSVVSNPAAGTQASASQSAGATGVRHVVDCVGFSAAATTAPTLTALTVNLRDGASGAGTVKWTYQVAIPATTGQSVAPYSVCGLAIYGSTATAMTLEFSAGLSNLIQSVSLSGYDVQ